MSMHNDGAVNRSAAGPRKASHRRARDRAAQAHSTSQHTVAETLGPFLQLLSKHRTAEARIDTAISRTTFPISGRRGSTWRSSSSSPVAKFQATLGLRGPHIAELRNHLHEIAPMPIFQPCPAHLPSSSSSSSPIHKTIDLQTLVERARGGSGQVGASLGAPIRVQGKVRLGDAVSVRDDIARSTASSLDGAPGAWLSHLPRKLSRPKLGVACLEESNPLSVPSATTLSADRQRCPGLAQGSWLSRSGVGVRLTGPVKSANLKVVLPQEVGADAVPAQGPVMICVGAK